MEFYGIYLLEVHNARNYPLLGHFLGCVGNVIETHVTIFMSASYPSLSYSRLRPATLFPLISAKISNLCTLMRVYAF